MEITFFTSVSKEFWQWYITFRITEIWLCPSCVFLQKTRFRKMGDKELLFFESFLKTGHLHMPNLKFWLCNEQMTHQTCDIPNTLFVRLDNFSLTDHHQPLGANCCLFNPENGDSAVLQDIGNDLSKTTTHPKRTIIFPLSSVLYSNTEDLYMIHHQLT